MKVVDAWDFTPGVLVFRVVQKALIDEVNQRAGFVTKRKKQ